MNIDEQKKILEETVEGKRKNLSMTDKFKFDCVGCGKCCFNNDILINTYDLIRLRHGLKKTTQEILQANYLNFYMGPSSGLPIVTINFKQLEGRFTSCPFLMPALNFDDVMQKITEATKGDEVKTKQMLELYKTNPELLRKDLSGIRIEKWLCAVHNDRLIICRLFPCGRIQEIDKATKEIKERFILQDDEESKKFCPGWQSQKEQSLSEFLTGQGFYQSKEGSAIFTRIMDHLIATGFFASTNDNTTSPNKSLFKSDSKVMMFLGNILYNFDSLNAFSQDPRVIKTIHDTNATQDDFLYVMNKVFDVVKKFTDLVTKQKLDDSTFQQFMNFLMKGGENK